jgi:hypothetical protein
VYEIAQHFFISIIFLEKSSELVDSAKQTAHEASVKAQELKESAGEKLETARKMSKYFLRFLFFVHTLFLFNKVNIKWRTLNNGLVKKDLK